MRDMWTNDVREKAINLRKQGKTYREICDTLNRKIPKGTLSYWCRGLSLDVTTKKLLHKKFLIGLIGSRERALHSKKMKREEKKADLSSTLNPVVKKLDDIEVAKVALAMLYFGEGFKKKQGSLGFGNSNPDMIRLFLRLLRRCYEIDEKKFRCTVQCRADQPQGHLEEFWSKVTGIPPRQFYATRVDARTEGKPTLKPEYKGVCRLDYFSANVFNELMLLTELISMGR